MHGIEINNKNPRHNNNNHLTKAVYEKHPHLIAIGGSDVHKKEDLCNGGICTNKKIRFAHSANDFVRCLKFASLMAPTNQRFSCFS